MSTGFKIIFSLVLLSIIALVIYLKVENNTKLKNTETEQPQIKSIKIERLISGVLEPAREISIKPQLSGILDKLYVEIGDKVKKGEQVARIRILADPNNLEISQKNLKTSFIRLQNEKKKYERNQSLFRKNIIPLVEIEKSEETYQLAQEEYKSAKIQHEIIQQGFSTKQKEVSNIVTATSNGTILELPLREGSSVIERNTYNEGTTIAVIADLENLIFKGFVNENDILYLEKNKLLNVNIPALHNFKSNASLSRISPKGSKQNGIMKFEIEAKIKISDQTKMIRSGYSAIANIVLQSKDSILTVSERNLIFKGDSSFVEILTKDYTTVMKGVKTGLSDGLRIEILEGLSDKDRVKVQNN
ncbi:efflux RND transporter periplasmic adaptor subunit [Marinifilum sp. D737]|uniref:efflux RND transporter periplasmic adaptor subunit n=1 Tax=Marinifilum sp. D737 TaxID=2969628 RepID=UPI002275ABBB|nr:efflux RND transporter periplasmic adaptor subunit [Marinifilum sp. D737]MCY1635965.1 efflux RND transporter periplasmic adaptor subunit [Marinifilum sp. D737]